MRILLLCLLSGCFTTVETSHIQKAVEICQVNGGLKYIEVETISNTLTFICQNDLSMWSTLGSKDLPAPNPIYAVSTSIPKAPEAPVAADILIVPANGCH